MQVYGIPDVSIKKGEEKMQFEVVKNNKILFYTENISCIHDKPILQQMRNNGYIFRIDGKKVNIKEIELLKNKMG